MDYFKQFSVVMNALDNRGDMVSFSVVIPGQVLGYSFYDLVGRQLGQVRMKSDYLSRTTGRHFFRAL